MSRPKTPPLSAEFVQSLHQALQAGAFQPVRLILESKTGAELAAFPATMLLLAQCHHDVCDFSGALVWTARLRREAPALAGTTWLWEARVHSAAGNEADADNALKHAEMSGVSKADLLTHRLFVNLSLGRIDRLSALRSDPAIQVLDASLLRLVDNLIALAERDAGLAAQLGTMRPWDRLTLREQDGAMLACRRAGEGPVPLFEPSRQARLEAEVIEKVWPQITITDPVLVYGVGSGHAIDHLLSVTPVVGKRLGLVVVVTDRDELVAALMQRDWSAPLRNGAIRFLGLSPAELADYLRGDLRRLPKRLAWAACVNIPGATTQNYLDEAQRITALVAAESARRLSETVRYYASQEFLDRWTNAGGSTRLRIMLQTCRYTTFIYHNSLHLAEAFSSLGHEVILLDEGGIPHHWVGPAYVQQQVAERRPDLFIRLNYLRQEESAYLPPGLPFLTWIQDYCQVHFEPTRSRRMLPRDYLTGFNKLGMLDVGYEPDHFLVCNVPSLAKVYSAPARSARSYRDEVSFVSHHSTEPARWLERFRTLGRGPHVGKWVDFLYRALEESYRAGRFVCQPLRELDRRAIDAVLGVPWPGWAQDYAIQLTNLFFRQGILRWIAEAGIPLAIYGNGWSDHSALGRFARGPVANGAALREVYRASRINLQLMTTGNLHQRLIDGLLAGGFFLMPAHEWLERWIDPSETETRTVLDVVGAEPITTFDELERRDPQLSRRLIEHAKRSDPGLLHSQRPLADRAFARLETELLSVAEARLPSLERCFFSDRDGLLAAIQDWRRRDADRENIIGTIQDSGRLQAMTAETLCGRLIRWLQGRIAIDPPVVVPEWMTRPPETIAPSGSDAETWMAVFRCVEDRGLVEIRNARRAATRGAPDHGGSLGTKNPSVEQGSTIGAWSVDLEQIERFTSAIAAGAKPPSLSAVWVERFGSGALQSECAFTDAVANGLKTEWYPSGVKKSEYRLVGGELHGASDSWHENGNQRRQGEFSRSRRTGRWECWNEAGQLLYAADYRAGKKTGRFVHWHPTGRVACEAKYEGDLPEGSWIEFHDNGVESAAVAYVKGQREGPAIWRHSNGVKAAEATFKSGSAVNQWFEWDDQQRHLVRARFSPGLVEWTEHYSSGAVKTTGSIRLRGGRGETIEHDESGSEVARAPARRVEQNVRGYNLFEFRGRFLAVANYFGELLPWRWQGQALADLISTKRCFQAATLETLREAIPPYDPFRAILVEQRFCNFNIVHYGASFFAISCKLKEIMLPYLLPDYIEELHGRRLMFSHDQLDDLKEAVRMGR